MNEKQLKNSALLLALLFHISGLIGILFTPYKKWFIQCTSINLFIMAVLLILTHSQKNKNFYIFLIITIAFGLTVEIIGVNTSLLFGNYTYGNILGIKVLNVPLITGINWFIIIYCAGMFTQVYENYLLEKMNKQEIIINKQIKLISFIIDAVFLVFVFDWVMEPVALKLGYWQWQDGVIPQYNYITWIVVSSVLFVVFRKLNQNKRNIFAVHLFIIQLLFFAVLSTFL